MQKQYFTWEQIENITNNLVDDINKSKKKYNYIVSLNRGGLIPGVLLSHKLGIEHGVMTVTHYDGDKMLDVVRKDLYISGVKHIKSHHNILLVDDISDSGICLKESIKTIKKFDSDAKNIDTATLFYKKKSIIVPTYYGEEVSNSTWINFPWESGVKVKDAVGV